MKKKVVFIMGIGRSGSTLIDLTIGSHPDAFSLGEISKLPNFVKKGKRKFCVREDSTFWQDHFTESELLDLAAGLSNHRLNKYIPLKLERFVREILRQDNIFNSYSTLFTKTKKNILVDSSKYISWIVNKFKAREFRAGLIEAYIIHMIRDGRAVANSYLRAFPKLTITEFSQGWVGQIQEQKSFYEKFPADRKMVVRYEELATNPQAVLERVCQLLAIEFTPEMIEYWRHDHHHIVGSRGTNALILKYRGQQLHQGVRELHGSYYQDMDLGIKFDLRWQKELAPEKLEVFNEIAGELNKPYEWEVK